MSKTISIATWNVERPTQSSKTLPLINAALRETEAEIIICTETHNSVSAGDEYFSVGSLLLPREHDGNVYKAGELRVCIFSKFPVVKQLSVTNAYTNACALVETSRGLLAVYGSIIGTRGRGGSFYNDLQEQQQDLYRLATHYPTCYAGDFNLSFCDNYFPNKRGKVLLEESFSRLEMQHLTADIPANIDHIILSNAFAHGATISRHCWNEDKRLSDHKGIMVTLQF